MKGATGGVSLMPGGLVISIHAPMKGATIANYPKLIDDIDFNPRTHEGCDAWVE